MKRILLLSLCLTSSFAVAQSSFSGGYLGAEISTNNQSFSMPYSELGYSNEMNYTGSGSRTTGIGIVGGYAFDFASLFVGAVEYHLKSTGNKTTDARGEQISKEILRTSLHYLQGVSLGNFSPYVKAGITTGIFKMNNTNVVTYHNREFENCSAIGLSYGAGLKYKFDQNFAIGLDYTKANLKAKNEIKFKTDSIGLNFTYHF